MHDRVGAPDGSGLGHRIPASLGLIRAAEAEDLVPGSAGAGAEGPADKPRSTGDCNDHEEDFLRVRAVLAAAPLVAAARRAAADRSPAVRARAAIRPW